MVEMAHYDRLLRYSWLQTSLHGLLIETIQVYTFEDELMQRLSEMVGIQISMVTGSNEARWLTSCPTYPRGLQTTLQVSDSS